MEKLETKRHYPTLIMDWPITERQANRANTRTNQPNPIMPFQENIFSFLQNSNFVEQI